MNYLEGLNKEQLEAVIHKDGPCLVVAGAGSGKTKVLTTRIAYLIDNGIPSRSILAITFTNKAAREMKDRVNKLVENNYSFVGTFHSLGVRILKENYELVGLDKNFTILDSDDSITIIKKILKDSGNSAKDISPSYIKNRISYIKNEMLDRTQIEATFIDEFDEIVKRVYYAYDKILHKNNAVDFDDLLKIPVELFKENPDLLDRYQERFKYILIDEYQDTNEVQYKLIKLLSQKYKNIFVVGDQNQSIYAFRQANYKNIVNFENDYQGTKVIVLNQNYRSTTNILNAANSVIKNNKIHKEVNLFSELGSGFKVKYLRANSGIQEVGIVVNEILTLLDLGYKKEDMAIFYRTNSQARPYEEAMIKANLPYKVIGSYYFYKRKEIKDLIAYLKLICNLQDDTSLKRIINEPKRGIGSRSIEKIEQIAELQNISIFEAINEGKELEFKKMILDLRDSLGTMTLTDFIDLVLDKTGMKKDLEKPDLDNELRLENLLEFKSITKNYEDKTKNSNLDDFLEEISLIADIEEHKEENDLITLMTLHSAKGLEFKVVFMVGMEENLLPHSNSLEEVDGLEEERRLCYVGITRAKERLYLTNAKKRIMYGKEMVNMPSRFITEINDEYIENICGETKEFNRDLLYNDINTEYKFGDVVHHLSFGRGIVTGVDDKFVTVTFSNAFGVKKFLKNYKGLKKGI